ncbi:MAG: ABC transporter permease [Desulfobaccales bacterium]
MHIRVALELRKDPCFLTGLGLAVILAALAFVGPAVAPFNPWDMSFAPLSPPSPQHLLGVNDGGNDIFSELLFGLRNTAGFGLFTGLAALLMGIVLGLVAAWFGGLVAQILMRLADILLAIPAVMILILTAALFRPAPLTLALILASLSWPTIARALRAQTLILRESIHVRAARQMGAGSWYILSRHLLPELFPLYLIGFAAKTRMAIFMEASLAYLGLFDPSRKSLGLMIHHALRYYYLEVWWNWLLPPIICLSLLIMTVTFLAVSLEKVFDPRLRGAL